MCSQGWKQIQSILSIIVPGYPGEASSGNWDGTNPTESEKAKLLLWGLCKKKLTDIAQPCWSLPQRKQDLKVRSWQRERRGTLSLCFPSVCQWLFPLIVIPANSRHSCHPVTGSLHAKCCMEHWALQRVKHQGHIRADLLPLLSRWCPCTPVSSKSWGYTSGTCIHYKGFVH